MQQDLFCSVSPNGVSPNGISPNGVSPNGVSSNGVSPNGVSPIRGSPRTTLVINKFSSKGVEDHTTYLHLAGFVNMFLD